MKPNIIVQGSSQIVVNDTVLTASSHYAKTILNQVDSNFFFVPIKKSVLGYNADSSVFYKEDRQEAGFFILPHFELYDSQVVRPIPAVIPNSVNYPSYGGWIIAFLYLALIIIAWARNNYNTYLDRIIKSVFSKQISNRLFKDITPQFVRANTLLNSLTIINLSVFFVLLLNYFKIGTVTSNFVLSLVIGLLLFTLVSIKVYLIKILGNVFYVKELSDEYIHSISVYNKSMGIFILPVIFVLPFLHQSSGKVILFIGIFLLLGFYTMLLIRGLRIIFNKHVRLFYLILYFCGLEILPILILYRTVKLLI
jgi:hypothetical protein